MFLVLKSKESALWELCEPNFHSFGIESWGWYETKTTSIDIVMYGRHGGCTCTQGHQVKQRWLVEALENRSAHVRACAAHVGDVLVTPLDLLGQSKTPKDQRFKFYGETSDPSPNLENKHNGTNMNLHKQIESREDKVFYPVWLTCGGAPNPLARWSPGESLYKESFTRLLLTKPKLRAKSLDFTILSNPRFNFSSLFYMLF